MRASVPAPKPHVPAESVATEALAAQASAALYSAPHAHRQQFDIALDDTALGPLRCQIALSPHGVEAIFVVQSTSQRWQIEARLQALREQLMARGLTVAAVRVLQEDDPHAPGIGRAPTPQQDDEPTTPLDKAR